jgi:diketogulonate reductase-like aldo/keto reductase
MCRACDVLEQVLSVRMTRRHVMLGATATAVAGAASGRAAAQAPAAAPTRPIPSSGEQLPLVGLGSWITFNVGEDRQLKDECAAVMAAFFAAGGRLIDSSPMYGSAQPTIGYGLNKLGMPATLFAADKVWTADADGGAAQIEATRAFWGVPRFDLLQVHNLLAWEGHLPLLFKMKDAGKLRYVGITTSHGRRHDDIEAVMRAHPIDFLQITYNVADREAEERILPLAQERGIAVIINRPFRQGELIQRLAGEPLPPWAADIGARSWAQLLLKFIVSHPAVTCAIPATTRVDHVKENLAAAAGPLPDEAARRRIAEYVQGL